MYHSLYNKSGELQSFITEYLRIVNADGKEHLTEVKKIVEIAELNGMKNSDIKSLIMDVDTNKVNALHHDEHNKFEQLFYLVKLLIGNDYYLDSCEFDFSIDMAERFGYDRGKAAQIIRKMHEGLKYETSEKEIKEKVIALAA